MSIVMPRFVIGKRFEVARNAFERCQSRIAQNAPELLLDPSPNLLKHRQSESLFGREVAVERSLWNFGGGGYLLHSAAIEALCKEELLSGCHQTFTDIGVLWSRHCDSSMTG